MKYIIKSIIKQVGILGLIAIKSNYNGNTEGNFYKSIGEIENQDWFVNGMILHYLRMIKDHAQYQNN